jgi:uncharacterized protein (TIGR02996 family)
MSDRDARMRAILEAPADDAPRLAFADWCEESGLLKWAKMIRHQVKFPSPVTAPPPIGLTVKFSDGVLAGRCVLGEELVPFGVTCIVLRRGFIESIEAPCETLLKHAEAIFAAHPVTAVKLWDRAPLRVVEGGVEVSAWCGGGDWENPGGHLPPELFEFLPRQVETDFGRRRGRRHYDNDEEALSALSAASVAFGRAKAELPWFPR